MLDRILRLPRTGLFLGALVVALLGLFIPGPVGAALLLAIVAGMAWLLTKTWYVQPLPARLLRVAVLALFVGLTIAKLT